MATDLAAPRLAESLPKDLVASVVVFLVALPLCLGVALASGAPLFSGLLAGIVGGLVVGALSGSHASVSGPAAGLTAVVAAQIAALGTFEAFLSAVVLAGLIQIAAGLGQAGFIAAYFPSSVIKGLLAAIGIILILKQIPHLLGHDTDPVGEMAFDQPDQQNTFTELWQTLLDLHPGAALVGLGSLAFLFVWDRMAFLKSSRVPAPLVVVVLGIAASLLLEGVGGAWAIGASHSAQVPVLSEGESFLSLLTRPDFSVLARPEVYVAALTIALVASLETLLNLEAVEALDPYKRTADPNRELLAQGVGNVSAGLIGGIPVTSVIIRSSVNLQAGARTRLSAIVHGGLLLVCVLTIPAFLNRIPLAALAAILIVTGVKLASPALMRDMWSQGRTQFLPFAVTILAIVFTDLLIGIGIGLGTALLFILASNMQRPVRRFHEKHVGGEVLRVELANQVSFLNRASITRILDEVPRGGHVMLDATGTDYFDPDVLALIQGFERETAPARGVKVSLKGFKEHYDHVEDRIQFVDFSTRERQSEITPRQVLDLLIEGNERFRNGVRISRDLPRQMSQTAQGQYPMAAILSCIDSRAPVELVFDLGLGDIFTVRIAGNVARSKVIGSLEYACVVAGAKLILVMGHTSCGAVNAAVDLLHREGSIADATGCHNLDVLIDAIQESVEPAETASVLELDPERKRAFADQVARRNVANVIRHIRASSPSLDRMIQDGRIGIAGAMYDVGTGGMELLPIGDDVPALAAGTAVGADEERLAAEA